MQKIQLFLWCGQGGLTALWLLAEPQVFQSAGFFALRGSLVQFGGVLAMACMSVAMILALRPRWPERWFGGLDKMYRLHKWLGIGGLSFAIFHWLWAKGPKWAVGLGLLERPQRGPRPVPDNAIGQLFGTLRGAAEGVGEWAFYGVVLLLALALIKRFPYRPVFKIHRLLAAAYLVLAFHAVVLTKFSYWTQPIGLILAPLIAYGVYAAVVVLWRRVGADRQVRGQIAAITTYPGVRAVEVEVELSRGWSGHQPGQFAFVTFDAGEGAHPYTIASAWNAASRRISFVIKGLGDHTARLGEALSVGQPVTVEGPYGCFTFDGEAAGRQIWVGGGIGITPFIARMKQMARVSGDMPEVHLFHTTAEVDETALAKLRQDAEAARIRLHILQDARDGRLDGRRIREQVPGWRDASVWFCGPAAFGRALRDDFAAHGLPVARRFHQELFAMR